MPTTVATVGSRSSARVSNRVAPAFLLPLIGALYFAAAPAASAADDHVIGLALSGRDFLLNTTQSGKEECPEGFVASDLEEWQAQFPTKTERQAQLNRCGATENRGPNCESGLGAPDLIKDPIPYREVKTTKSFGLNLDGTPDGRATATTCTHQKFTSPEGVQGVDNQLFRILGCLKAARSDTFRGPEKDRGIYRISVQRKLRTLLEIRGVNDAQNDPDVDVYIYQGRDTLIVDSESRAVPWQTQKVDTKIPPQRMHGRIVNGELITEPADTLWEDQTLQSMEPAVLIRGAQLRLKLDETSAKGMRTGYADVESWWTARHFVPSWSIYNDSPPALYEALHRLADGYKNPATGQCTALSSAIQEEYTRVYISHTPESPVSALSTTQVAAAP